MWTKCSWACRRLSGACVSLRSAGVCVQWRRRLDRNRCRPHRASRRDTHRSLGAWRVHQADRRVAGGPGSSIGRKARHEAIGRLCALQTLWAEGVGYCTMKARISNSRVAGDAEPEPAATPCPATNVIGAGRQTARHVHDSAYFLLSGTGGLTPASTDRTSGGQAQAATGPKGPGSGALQELVDTRPTSALPARHAPFFTHAARA